MDQLNVSDLLIGAATAATILVIGHWFPLPTLRWAKIPPSFEASKLPKSIIGLIGRYTYGVVALLIGVFVWTLRIGQVWIVVGLVGICVAGGAIVTIAYVWDWVMYHIDRSSAIERAEELTK